MTNKKIESVFVKIDNRISELERLLQILEEFSIVHLIPSEVSFCSRLALEEMITNLLKYGYRDSAEHIISVRIFLSELELTMEIENDADAFNPFEANVNPPAREAMEKAKGGHGLLLVRTLMDELHYCRQHDKNILIIRKKMI